MEIFIISGRNKQTIQLNSSLILFFGHIFFFSFWLSPSFPTAIIALRQQQKENRGMDGERFIKHLLNG